MIASGRVVVDDQTLANQAVKNGAQIMIVFLHNNPNEIREAGKLQNELESLKADTSLLASKHSDYYMNVSVFREISEDPKPTFCRSKISLEIPLSCRRKNEKPCS